MEMGAGTFHPATTLRALGPRPWRAAYVQPSRRPKDGRYGENPNRLQHYYQYQVILKPAPADVQELYLGSAARRSASIPRCTTSALSKTIGKARRWAPGAGLGSVVRRDGDHAVHLFPAGRRHRLRSGVARRSPTVSNASRCMCRTSSSSTTSRSTNSSATAKCSTRAEREYSAFNFETRRHRDPVPAFRGCGEGMPGADRGRSSRLPAYDQCIKASHCFNLLDARGVISA